MKNNITQLKKAAENSNNGESKTESAAEAKPEVLTAVEAAVFLRVGINWVYRHCDRVGAYHVGKFLRFSRKRLQEYLDSTTAVNRKPNDPSLPRENSGFPKPHEQK